MSVESTRSTVIASLVIHIAVLALFAILLTVFQRPDPGPEPIEVVFYKPGEYVPPPPAPPLPEPQPEPEPEPEVEIAKLAPEPKPELRPERPPVQEIRVAKLQPPPAPKPEPEPVKPKRPRREVKTNLLNAAITKPATVMPARERKTTTGSFGTTETSDAPSRPRLRGGTQVGNFAVADTPEPHKTPSRDVVKTSGFGAADAGPAPDRRANDPGDVKTGDFGSTAPAQRPRSKPKVATEAPDTPVEVLSKPTPIYTAEAREQRVEGEVTLRVTFVASGKIEILEVLKPLGHGLDEAAIDAAKRIRFKPARRDGRPVDHTAVLRIVFQLV
jgi:TonB family protein